MGAAGGRARQARLAHSGNAPARPEESVGPRRPRDNSCAEKSTFGGKRLQETVTLGRGTQARPRLALVDTLHASQMSTVDSTAAAAESSPPPWREPPRGGYPDPALSRSRVSTSCAPLLAETTPRPPTSVPDRHAADRDRRGHGRVPDAAHEVAVHAAGSDLDRPAVDARRRRRSLRDPDAAAPGNAVHHLRAVAATARASRPAGEGHRPGRRHPRGPHDALCRGRRQRPARAADRSRQLVVLLCQEASPAPDPPSAPAAISPAPVYKTADPYARSAQGEVVDQDVGREAASRSPRSTRRRVAAAAYPSPHRATSDRRRRRNRPPSPCRPPSGCARRRRAASRVAPWRCSPRPH